MARTPKSLRGTRRARRAHGHAVAGGGVTRPGVATPSREFDYDLRPYGGAGTIPRPGAEQLAALVEALREVAATIEGVDSRATPAEILAQLEAASPDERGVSERLLDPLIAACQGSPSRDEVMALPWKLQRHFAAMALVWFVRVAEPRSAG